MAVFSVTQALVSWLGSMGFAASSRVPRDAPAEFLTVERVGGRTAAMVDVATVALQAWAATDAAAEALACAARHAVLTRMPPPGVHSVRVESGPYAFYDEHTGMARYQMTLAVPCQVETKMGNR